MKPTQPRKNNKEGRKAGKTNSHRGTATTEAARERAALAMRTGNVWAGSRSLSAIANIATEDQLKTLSKTLIDLTEIAKVRAALANGRILNSGC